MMKCKEFKKIMSIIGVRVNEDLDLIDVEPYYVNLKRELSCILKTRMILKSQGVDIFAIDTQIDRYRIVLSALEDNIYKDTIEQDMKAINLIHSYKGTVLGKKEQKELLDGIRDIYNRYTPSPNYTEKYGLGAWLSYISSIVDYEELYEYYFEYKFSKNNETKWCDLVITDGSKYIEEEEPIKEAKKIKLPF